MTDETKASTALYVPQDAAEYERMIGELEQIAMKKLTEAPDDAAFQMVASLVACLKHRDARISADAEKIKGLREKLSERGWREGK